MRTNYSEISVLAHQYPVAITVNGRKDTVLLSHTDFLEQQRAINELQERFAIYAQLAQSQDDIKLGRIQLLHSAVESICNDLDNLDL